MNKRGVVLFGIVVAAALSRLLPHPPNFTPIGAMALFGGAYLTNRTLAFLLPLAAMLLSDVVLGWTVYGHAMYATQPVVYACIAGTVALGILIRDRRSPWQIGAATLAAAILFFAFTNFAEWAAGHLYPLTTAGLVACFAAAIPFFRNSLLGDGLYATALFGGYALLEDRLIVLRESASAGVTRSR